MSKSKILIIDDEDLFREDLTTMLRRAGYECLSSENAAKGIEATKINRPDIILCDIAMPDASGVEIISELGRLSPGVAIIMLTAFGTLETALEAFRQGAVDYLLKPISKDELLSKIGRADTQSQLVREITRLRRIINQRQDSEALIGNSSPMLEVKEIIRRIAEVDSPVLISGESGTGKEVVARELHRLSPRRDAPFLAINCGAIPDSLLESEIFGHVKGAFTGAVDSRQGFFELAGEGSLLLDEIGDMPLSLQTKLLRALEQREYFRVGCARPIPLQARILSSTNRKLADQIAKGEFREDLYYRIDVVEVSVPSLRERPEDIPSLVEHFARKLCAEMGRPQISIDKSALEVFMNYSWPGNVRQLRNALERAIILCVGDLIYPADLPPEIARDARTEDDLSELFRGDDLKNATRRFEQRFIHAIIGRCQGNRELAAKRMGINPSTLYRKLSDEEHAP